MDLVSKSVVENGINSRRVCVAQLSSTVIRISLQRHKQHVNVAFAPAQNIFSWRTVTTVYHFCPRHNHAVVSNQAELTVLELYRAILRSYVV